MSDNAQQFIQFLDEITRARGRTNAVFRDIRMMHGMTEVENVVLTAVTGASHSPTVPQIGRSLGHPRQVIQRAADALVVRGLIEWRDNPDHKRARLLTATAEGQRLRHLADIAGIERAARFAVTIDPTLLAATVAGLRTIRESIENSLRTIGEQAEPEDGEEA
ncbi:MarR family transcriptional regulator (plasmid) [Sphingomonas paeninsulae]|jgi:DNA-binding MarR family transcriptional regulator|uniref:MarR family transcriptional regulator n=1 Tax=Sphingomonas paeninsulae TaxID=2319844 RepID=A0A494T7X4_SPHPE|nr:helix-turn-helix domain-containing protein [Sphingomonas paeninsulae]AYJ85417.1 MarR family transcriptional regulator [Sphingomonas paeninsulae]